MIGIDANVLIRYVTQDDPDQSAKAATILEHQLTEENPGFVSLVALAEITWVLSRSYEKTSNEIASFVEILLRATNLVVQAEEQVYAAMNSLREGYGSFADALIAELGIDAGCAYTLTFDRKALRIPGFKLA